MSFSQKYRKHELPKGTVLVHYCASAHSISVSQYRLHGILGMCILAQALWSLCAL